MSEYDSPWKEFLDYFFKAFLEFGFLELHDEIDWSQPVGVPTLSRNPILVVLSTLSFR